VRAPPPLLRGLPVRRALPLLLFPLALAVACDEGGATDAPDAGCTPYAHTCRGSDRMVCPPAGGAWVLSDPCPLGCVAGACVSDDADVPAPDTGGDRRGCLGCPCDFGEACDAGLTCFAGWCLPTGCQTDGDCPADRRCYLGGCIPALCGNSLPDAGEECDDGNNRNGDGCNVKCAVESDHAIAGGEPLGFTSDPGALPVAFSACDDASKTGPWAPGDTVAVKACATSYLDQDGYGLSAAEVAAEVEAAGRFYAEAGTAIRLDLIHVAVVQGSPDLTNPDTLDEIGTLLRRLRQDADAAHPGECGVVLGYVHSLSDNGGAFGGMGSWPVEGIHSAAVTVGNVRAVPGQTTAHELGHVVGLYHTFEPSTGSDDGCEDTAPDANCSNRPPACEVTCPDGSHPPAQNVMSYYFCTDARSDSFSACQARRARCFLSRMFPADACPLPVLQIPSEGQSFPAGEDIEFRWKPGQAGAAHEVLVRRDPPSGAVVIHESAGAASSWTAAAGALAPGQYAWTARYAATCCPDGKCDAVERRFQVASVACTGASTEACGWCGQRSRQCRADGTWSDWGPCTGQGECQPGVFRSCAGAAAVQCGDDCAWPACPDCATDCAGRCAGAGDGCGGTCPGNLCDGCCDGTACLPGDDAGACGTWGAACRVCATGASCDGGTCAGCGRDAGEPRGCGDGNDTAGCAIEVATLDSEKDQWVSLAWPFAPSPDDDADHVSVSLTSTDFFAILDPAVAVSNRSGADLEACLWWRNADGSDAVLSNGSCTAGTPSTQPAEGTRWDGAPGCCVTVPDQRDGLGPHFYVADAPGEALVRVRPLHGGACGRYSLQIHL
jgi:hypothetical protein